MEIKVGTLACISHEFKDVLGNKPGTIGVCYEVYKIRERGTARPGYAFIFPNGSYNSFSLDNVREMLCVIGDTNFRYRFLSFMELENNFRAGQFDWLKQLPVLSYSETIPGIKLSELFGRLEFEF